MASYSNVVKMNCIDCSVWSVSLCDLWAYVICEPMWSVSYVTCESMWIVSLCEGGLVRSASLLHEMRGYLHIWTYCECFVSSSGSEPLDWDGQPHLCENWSQCLLNPRVQWASSRVATSFPEFGVDSIVSLFFLIPELRVTHHYLSKLWKP